MFFKIGGLRNSQYSSALNFRKKRLQHRCFPLNMKFLIIPILKNNCERLPLFTFSQDFKSIKSDLDCTKSFLAAIEILMDTGRKSNVHKTLISCRPQVLLKKRLWQRCFPVNFAKFLRTSFLQNTSGRLLLFF